MLLSYLFSSRAIYDVVECKDTTICTQNKIKCLIFTSICSKIYNLVQIKPSTTILPYYFRLFILFPLAIFLFLPSFHPLLPPQTPTPFLPTSPLHIPQPLSPFLIRNILLVPYPQHSPPFLIHNILPGYLSTTLFPVTYPQHYSRYLSITLFPYCRDGIAYRLSM